MKNIILFLFLFFLNSCGYTSIYKNQKSQDFQINIIEMTGDNVNNNLIKNELKFYSNRNSNIKYNISINSNYQKIIVSKNSAGVATDYKLLVDTKISINLNNKINKYNLSLNNKQIDKIKQILNDYIHKFILYVNFLFYLFIRNIFIYILIFFN